MKKSRTKRVMLNVATSLTKEVVSLVCGLILPRLILSNFGSAYNGITQSITQFISYIELMKAGIGGATIAALYKPVAEKDDDEISEILTSTEKFMRKISMLFALFVLVFAALYPILIVKEFDWLFTSSLILIISITTFAQYYFGFTYQCLLTADQKDYITTILQIITILLNTIVSVILINNGCTIHIVKLGSASVNLISPLFLYFYVRKKYHIYHKESKEDKIPQKWSAAAHEVASFVNNNTDVVILTLFSNMLEISVYSVYHYVVANIKKIVTNFTVGFGSAFGDMYAKNEIDLMKKNLGIFELIIYSFASITCSVTLVMIIPFVLLYTKGVTDVNYDRPIFALVITVACAFNCFRVPYRAVVYALGHYKQTRNGAILEAVLNIVISVVCVIKFGLVGVSIGTMVAMAFRTFQYAIYLSKNIINRDLKYFYSHIIICFVIMAVVYYISKIYMANIGSWLEWVLYAAITTIIAIILTVVTDLVFYKDDFFGLFNKLKVNFIKK